MQFEIASALHAMQTGMSLAVGAIEARDNAKAKAAIAEVSAKMTGLNMEALRMSEHLRKLESELLDTTRDLRAAQKRLGEREKYVLRAVADGVFAYAYEPLGDDPTPAHYRCQVCHDRGEASILTRTPNGTYLQCRVDPKHILQVGDVSQRVIAKRRSSGLAGY